jgi:hypothetical protein
MPYIRPLGLPNNGKRLEAFLAKITLGLEACVDDDVSRDNLELVRKAILADTYPRRKKSYLLLDVAALDGDKWDLLCRLLALGFAPTDKSNLSAAHVAVRFENYECAKRVLMCRPWEDVDSHDAEDTYSLVRLRIDVEVCGELGFR